MRGDREFRGLSGGEHAIWPTACWGPLGTAASRSDPSIGPPWPFSPSFAAAFPITVQRGNQKQDRFPLKQQNQSPVKNRKKQKGQEREANTIADPTCFLQLPLRRELGGSQAGMPPTFGLIYGVCHPRVQRMWGGEREKEEEADVRT